MIKSTIRIVKVGILLVIFLTAFALIYLVFSTNQDRKEASRLCQQAYPNNTEVVGVVGLDIGTVCFDESGENVKYLGMLEE